MSYQSSLNNPSVTGMVDMSFFRNGDRREPMTSQYKDTMELDPFNEEIALEMSDGTPVWVPLRGPMPSSAIQAVNESLFRSWDERNSEHVEKTGGTVRSAKDVPPRNDPATISAWREQGVSLINATRNTNPRHTSGGVSFDQEDTIIPFGQGARMAGRRDVGTPLTLEKRKQMVDLLTKIATHECKLNELGPAYDIETYSGQWRDTPFPQRYTPEDITTSVTTERIREAPAPEEEPGSKRAKQE